ncbi:Acetoacetyl-CoA synthetase [Cyphellophora attinorum]|uniref:Acetoacetyl-CoA synthetase n=1 Tax=Cyphellophora attinorum TaxID=1664694 RepID=A0A0N1HS14_9EURO|nr:Acetoacetyl-CoA synthetase [Phialophora attinorum]KPI38787.1 Acetoacetyl-CoA synthetase [Phialophora attinorum]
MAKETGPIYTPPPDLVTNLDRFRDYVNRKHNLKFTKYEELHRFSVTRLNDFWLAVWDFCNIKSENGPGKAIDDNAKIDQFPKFFVDARINYAENALQGDDDRLAIIDMNETNIEQPTRYSWKQLRHLVAQYAGILRRQGVSKGDVVVLVGGNSARSLSILLAAASIGAVFASFATDIGEKALADRVGQLKPKLLFAELVYRYNGKLNDITSKIEHALNAIDGAKPQVIVLEQATTQNPSWTPINSVLGSETDADLIFERVPFNTPLIVMFSSGTTGVPKGIVHSQGGLMINGVKEHKIHNNFGSDDIHYHYSGTGWTLWNISMGALFCRSAMLLYDGSPFHPNPDTFLRAVFKQGVTGYGGSPRYFSELQKLGIKPKEYALPPNGKMHTIHSTGALLTPGTARYLAEAFGPVCQIGFSGGTELCGNFMTGTRSLPCYAGEIAVKELGMDVDAFDPSTGKPVEDGTAGELVCKKPFPNMPVCFWNDPEFNRYHKSYFQGFPGVWTHGDLIRVNPETKGIYVLGRSDGVLNPSGQRQTAKYSDAAERVILFLKVADGHSSGTLLPRSELREKIKAAIIKDLSRRHVPHFMFEVSQIPHNANGKKQEIQVKQICNRGQTALDGMTLPDAERDMLKEFVKFHDVEKVVTEDSGRLSAKL